MVQFLVVHKIFRNWFFEACKSKLILKLIWAGIIFTFESGADKVSGLEINFFVWEPANN